MNPPSGIPVTLPVVVSSLLRSSTTTEVNDGNEDAVLVDSFFLPGGLLADDDDINNKRSDDVVADGRSDLFEGGGQQSSSNRMASSVRAARASAASRSNVPSNPWERPEEHLLPPPRESLSVPPKQESEKSNGILEINDAPEVGEVGVMPKHHPPSAPQQRRLPDGTGNSRAGGRAGTNIDPPGADEVEEDRMEIASLFRQHEELRKKTLLVQHKHPTHHQTNGEIAPPPGFQRPLISSRRRAAAGSNNGNSKSFHNTSHSRPTPGGGASSKDSQKNVLGSTKGGGGGISSNGGQNFEESSTMEGEVLQMSSSNAVATTNPMATDWDFEFSGPLTALNNRAIQRPLHSERFRNNSLSLGGAAAEERGGNVGDGDLGMVHSTSAGEKGDGGESHFTPVDEGNRVKDDQDHDEDDDAGGSYREFLSPLTTDTRDIREFIDFGKDDYGDGQENEEEEEDEEDDESDDPECTDIPMDIHEHSLDESNASSLSSSSTDLDNSDVFSQGPDEADCEGDEQSPGDGVGYDTDQAHVSQIVGIADEEDRIDEADGKSLTPAPSAVCSAEDPPKSTSYLNTRSHQQSRQDLIPTIQTLWQRLLSYSFAILVHYPSKAFLRLSHSIATTIRQSQLYSSVTRQAEALNRRIDRVATWSSGVWQWLVDLKDVLATLVSKLLTTVRKLLATTTKALILIASFLFQVWKFSLIEAFEESSVTICYLVFYFMPNLCALLMRHLNLPHWTPHIMTWLGVSSLCHQVKAGALLQDDVSIFRLSGTLTATTGADGKGLSSSSAFGEVTDPPQQHEQQYQEETKPRDERACRTILRILRFVLPIFFVADGFSSQFGTIMGVSGASRLTTAFMMSLVRKNLVSSPIGWVSWAIQVLVATYYPNWTFLDSIVIVVGLSSIRLIRYLDGQRLRKKHRRPFKND
jgi:hypothetical protein